MPIRINLLAEQQAAEEARRRDPVKRALWAGGALVALMGLWIVSLQLRVVSAKAELNRCSSKLQAVDENSKDARLSWAETSQLQNRLENLQRYTTNRFFCANVLNAMQQLEVDEVRVVHLQSTHTFSTNAPVTFKTNMVFPIESRKAWQFWKARPAGKDIPSLVASQINVLTTKVESLITTVPLTTKVDITTNGTQATAKIEITKPATAAERVLLTIKARDYSNPAGKRVDEFSRALANHPYFAERLNQGEGKGIRLRERAIQPEIDQADPVRPGKPFVPFVIECRYREILRANE